MVREKALGVFEDMDVSNQMVHNWAETLKAYKFKEDPHEAEIWYTCVLALKAVSEGNYGVGSVIVSDDGEIVAEGYNKLLKPYVRTDQHAEMNALTEFEEKYRHLSNRLGFTLYTSLECCPMCTTRLINSGIRQVYYAASDPECGMVEMIENMPPFWTRMINSREPKQVFAKAKCSTELSEVANGIFLQTETILSSMVSSF